MEVFHAGRMGFPELKGPNVTWEPGLLVIDNGNLIDFGFGFFFLLLVMSETNSPTVSN